MVLTYAATFDLVLHEIRVHGKLVLVSRALDEALGIRHWLQQVLLKNRKIRPSISVVLFSVLNL
jgi:hypothetical protein